MYCGNLTALTSLLNSTHLIALSCCPTELSVAELISKVFSSPSNPVIYNFILNLPKHRVESNLVIVFRLVYRVFSAFFAYHENLQTYLHSKHVLGLEKHMIGLAFRRGCISSVKSC